MRPAHHVLGWSEALTRFGDGTRMAHLVIAPIGNDQQARAACGTQARLSGMVEKPPREGLTKCGRCRRYRP